MSSRASTQAGRRRSASRAGSRTRARQGTKRPAAKRPAAKSNAKRAAPKSGAKRAAPKSGAKRAAPKSSAKRPARKRTTAKAPARKRPAARRPAPKAGARKAGTRRLPSLRTSLIGLTVLAVTVAAGYFAWLRDSSVVAVREVKVTGLASPESAQIEAALTDAARSMTTLHVQIDELEDAVKGFPTVVSVSADADLLHGLEIAVTERPPTLVAESGSDAIPVAADGTLLRGVELGSEGDRLPVLQVDELPSGGRLEGEALEQGLVLGAAPAPLRPLIDKVELTSDSGVEVTLRGGFEVRFGESAHAAEKWAAAAAVLADPKLDTLTYVDVRVPERPAVGGAAPPAAPEPVEPAL